ncbi:MAG TPA: hypothetical protein VF423_02010 [Actinomycetes bacterium]
MARTDELARIADFVTGPELGTQVLVLDAEIAMYGWVSCAKVS